MLDFGVELRGVDPLFDVLHSGNGANVSGGNNSEALGNILHGIEMAHPNDLIAGGAFEQIAARNMKLGRAVFANLGMEDGSA